MLAENLEEVWSLDDIANHLGKSKKTLQNAKLTQEEGFPEPLVAFRWYKHEILHFLNKRRAGRPRLV